MHKEFKSHFKGRILILVDGLFLISFENESSLLDFLFVCFTGFLMLKSNVLFMNYLYKI